MLIEDRAAREEACDVRHRIGKARACDIPREPVDENVQYEFSPRRAVPEADRRADGIDGIRGRRDLGRLRETELTERPLAEIGGCRRLGFCRDGQLLQRLRPCDGENDPRPLRHLDRHAAAYLLCLLQTERVIPLHSIDEDVGMPHFLDYLTWIREERIIDIGSDPVARAFCGRREREIFPYEGVKLKLQCMICVCEEGTILCHRGTCSDPCGDGEPVKSFLFAAHEKIRGNLGGEI